MIRRLALALGTVVATAALVQAEPLPLSKEEQAKVDQAIDKAVAFLKNTQRKKGFWDLYPLSQDDPYGATALPALALLEAGVPADDPVVQKAAECLRPHLAKLDHTYELSLALLFFDKLGDPQDKAAIRSLALRLIAGQCRSGGWYYRCPSLSASNEEALPDVLRQWEEATAGNKAPPAIPKALKVLTVFQDPAQLAAWQDPPIDARQCSVMVVHGAYRQLEYAVRHPGPVGGAAARLAVGADAAAGSPTLRELSEPGRHLVLPLPPRARRPRPQRTVRSMTTVGLLGLALREGVRPEKERRPAHRTPRCCGALPR